MEGSGSGRTACSSSSAEAGGLPLAMPGKDQRSKVVEVAVPLMLVLGLMRLMRPLLLRMGRPWEE